MNFDAIEKVIEDAAGLDTSSIGANVVHRIIKLHMGMTGALDVESYYEKIKSDRNELQSLIEDVTVPETWFFRDRAPFDLLAKLIRDKWSPPSGDRILRVLSLPCATGEEAYSIAMKLRDLGFGSDSVRIDAIDISRRALARASEAIYGDNSFRGDEGNYIKRYFEDFEGKRRVCEPVRRMVKFSYGNLLDDKFLIGAELYDIIFCRNVMIYFSRELQSKAIKKLHRILAIDGVLFVGHAEAANLSGGQFSTIKYPGAFGFQKKIAEISNAEKFPQSELKLVSGGEDVVSMGVSEQLSGGVSRPKNAFVSEIKRKTKVRSSDNKVILDEAPPTQESVWEQIRQMADVGKLKEASRLCEEVLKTNAVNSEAYFLLGLIREAEANEAEANNLFRKAVYLNPHHYEALVHLAVLYESQGNLAAAAVYRARASRLSKDG